MRCLFTLVCTLLACLSILALSTVYGDDKDKKDKPTTVTEKDNEGKVTVIKGKELLVSLDIIQGTGYTWEVAKKDDKQLEKVGDPTIEKAQKGVVGGKAQQVFRFKAAEKGDTTLELNYRRPFEKDKDPAKTFKIKVTVKE